MKKILLFLKSLFTRKNKIDIKKNENEENILNNIEIGTIIWAKRYKTIEEKEQIPEGHREGQFIVLDKTKDKLICSYGTSTVPNERYINKYLKLSCEKYNLYKNTYFRLNNVLMIDAESFIDTMDILEEKDKDLLFNTIKRLARFYYYESGVKKQLNLPLQICDIINHNYKNYLVLKIENDKNEMICLELNNMIYNLTTNDFENIDYTKIKSISISDEYKILTSINKNLLLYVLKRQKEYLDNLNKKTITQRGSLIIKNNKYYYIYGEESQDWLIFEVKDKKEPKMQEIKINMKKFYTNYKQDKINKKESFKVISLASSNEIEDIKNSKKSYSKTHKNTNSKPNCKDFDIGDIIVSEEFGQERFIIIGKCKKTYECVSIPGIIKGKYYSIYIKKEKCLISKNKSISGIIWLEEHNEFNLKDIASEDFLNIIFKRQDEYIDGIHKNEKINLDFGNCFIKDGEEYITIEVINDIVSCINICELEQQQYTIQYFKIKDINNIKKLDINHLKELKLKLINTLPVDHIKRTLKV